RRGNTMGCDMCGNDGRLFVTMVEGTEMQLCNECKKYGEVKRTIPTVKEVAVQQKTFTQQKQHRTQHDNSEVFEMIVSNYGKLIKEAREARGKKQEQLAKQLAMKESQLHKYESEHKRPDIETARMLERALGIKLVKAYTEDRKNPAIPGATSSGPLT
ncbi:TIGR00270 family protein, partial [Candidatus Woesearchaeota archaeon]|nr:TIGR00270 family protein [Candidatus Woesearchaeota archaeon]